MTGFSGSASSVANNTRAKAIKPPPRWMPPRTIQATRSAAPITPIVVAYSTMKLCAVRK